MRTTVTLDPDVEALLRQVMRERGISFKQALNGAIRDGLRSGPIQPRPFVQKTYDMGGPAPGVNLDKALSLAFELEDEETLRKMKVLEERAGEKRRGT